MVDLVPCSSARIAAASPFRHPERSEGSTRSDSLAWILSLHLHSASNCVVELLRFILTNHEQIQNSAPGLL
jgi:hypothetical protein